MMLHIRPADGKVILDHRYPHPPIPETGAWVAPHPYWSRKLARNDVVLIDAVVESAPALDLEPVKRKKKEA